MPETPWRPSRPTTVLIGILSIWPFLYMLIFLGSFAFEWSAHQTGKRAAGADLFRYIFPLHCGTMLIILASTGIYIFHAYKTDRIADDKRVLWVIILFLGNMVAFPVYWYLYLWRRPREETRTDAASPPAG